MEAGYRELGKEDAAYALAKNIVKVEYGDIPREALEVAKRDILDTLGVAIAASSLVPWCKEIVELVREGGGKGESTIIVFGGRVPSWMAALANGAMAHCLDYDDTCDDGYTHLGMSTIPPAFAIAERLGKVSGKEFLTAVTLGLDLNCRLGLAAIRGAPDAAFSGWLHGQLFGFFTAATTAGKLLRLDEDKMLNAPGIADAQASGNMECAWGGEANTREMYGGFTSKGGVLSALMAQRGITGAKNVLEGKAGLYPLHYHGYDLASLTTDLGNKFEGINLSFKPWPSGRTTHRFIEGAWRIVQGHAHRRSMR